MSNDLTTLYKGKHLHLVRRGTWEFAQRPNISGIVGILAVTDDRKLILVEQFRPPVNANVIELPARLAGDLADARGEALADAASRELLEETGYAARAMTQLAEGPISAGISDEILTLFRATGLTRQSDGGGDESEKITIHLVPLDEIDEFLQSQREAERMIDLKVYSGLRFLR